MADFQGCRVQVVFMQKDALPDTAGTQIKRSMCAYADALRDKVIALYPGAEVVVYCVKGDSLPPGLHRFVDADGKARSFNAAEELSLTAAHASAAKTPWKVAV